MIELFTLMHNTLPDSSETPIQENTYQKVSKYPLSWILVSLIIGFFTAYLAYSCNEKETPATRCVITLFAFFFSAIYLVYYFIIYVILNKHCSGRDVSDLFKMMKK